MTDERARELEMRNMGEIGDLMSNDPEVIAAAGGVSVGEVHSLMQEIPTSDPTDSTEDVGEQSQSPIDSDSMSSGPGANTQQPAERDPSDSVPSPSDGPAPERDGNY